MNGDTLDDIEKGFPVYVCGRLRTQKYIAGDGSEKTSYDIIANTMEILGSKQVSPQMG